MISLEECRKDIEEKATDKEVENVRNDLYTLVEQAMDFMVNSGILSPQRNEKEEY